MRTLLLATALAVAALPSFALADTPKPLEPGPWKFGEVVSLNLSQSTFSSNWSGGDKGSIVWVLGSASSAERQFTRRFHSANTLTLAYGQTSRQEADPGDPGARVWSEPDKTTDQILFESVGRFTLERYVDPYFAVRAESQFQDESNPLGVVRVNPVKLKETAGVARVIEKIDTREAITRLGFGFRQTFGRDLVAVDPRRTESYSSNDGGFEWQTNVKRPVLDGKVLWTSTLLVFQPVFYSSSDELERFDADVAAQALLTHEPVADFWKATDVNFQNTFTAQITKHLNVNLFAQWVYDKYDATANLDPALPLAARAAIVDRSTRKAGQFKETLALGFSYRLF